MSDFIQYLTNPITSKIIGEMDKQGVVTAKYLADKYKDIPHATLYRYLNRLHEDNVIIVVQENKVRGTYEKSYSLRQEFKVELSNNFLFDKNLKPIANFGQIYMDYFLQYMKGLIKEFKEYTDNEDEKTIDDGSGFFIYPIYATHDELMNFVNQSKTMLAELASNQPSPERKLRNIALITTPPKNKADTKQ